MLRTRRNRPSEDEPGVLDENTCEAPYIGFIKGDPLLYTISEQRERCLGVVIEVINDAFVEERSIFEY
jgi:hypothetical protein